MLASYGRWYFFITSQKKNLHIAKVSRFIKFTPEFTKLLTEHSLKSNVKVCHGPSSGVSLVDDCGNGETEDVKFTLLKCFPEVSNNDSIRSFVPSPIPNNKIDNFLCVKLE